MADLEYAQTAEDRHSDRDESDDTEPTRAGEFDPTPAQSPHPKKARGRALGPLWDGFHVGERKNPSHMWAVCRACASQVAGTKVSMASHIKNCRKLSGDDKTSFLERVDVKTALETTRTIAQIKAVAYPFFLLAGPNVIQSEEHAVFMARNIKSIADDLGLPFVFKASFDKANRTSASSFRGPGLEEGLKILSAVKRQVAGLRILTDVHESDQCEKVGEVVDILQIPAFLCRQTDLIQSAARTGKVINIKKGQFCAPEMMTSAAEKVRAAGNPLVLVCERGTMFGYHDLILDPRNLVWMRSASCPVVADITHSLQQPGVGQGDNGSICSGGLRDLIPTVGRACVAVGIDGLFMEVHDDPLTALVDGPTQWPLRHLRELLEELVQIAKVSRGRHEFKVDLTPI